MPEHAPAMNSHGQRTEPAREIIVTDDGPLLICGPVEIVLPGGRRVRSDRPVTALCICKRSRTQPFCDTSHRCRVRTGDLDPGEDRAQS